MALPLVPWSAIDPTPQSMHAAEAAVDILTVVIVYETTGPGASSCIMAVIRLRAPDECCLSALLVKSCVRTLLKRVKRTTTHAGKRFK